MVVPYCVDDLVYHDGNCILAGRVQTGKQSQKPGTYFIWDSACGKLFMAVFLFGAGWYTFALLWLLLLWGLVYWCICVFAGFSKKAVYLMIPYIIWLTFAGYLNLFIALWN